MKKIHLLTLLFIPFTAQAGDVAAGKVKAASCIACHGENGVSQNEDWPNLAGQKEKYLAKQINAFRGGQRVNPLMDQMVKPLTNEDVANLAAYYASLNPCAE